MQKIEKAPRLWDLQCGVGGDFLSTLGWFSGLFHGVLGALVLHFVRFCCKNSAETLGTT